MYEMIKGGEAVVLVCGKNYTKNAFNTTPVAGVGVFDAKQ